MEAGVVIDINGEPLYWHLPEERTVVSLPDSQTLWDIFWTNRNKIAGFAHSHPGSGIPGPSYEDVTTFAPIEAAIGKRLDWWITSSNSLIVVKWAGPERLDYKSTTLDNEPSWVEQLRKFSLDNLTREVQHDTGNSKHRREYHPGQ